VRPGTVHLQDGDVVRLTVAVSAYHLSGSVAIGRVSRFDHCPEILVEQVADDVRREDTVAGCGGGACAHAHHLGGLPALGSRESRIGRQTESERGVRLVHRAILVRALHCLQKTEVIVLQVPGTRG